MFSENVYLSGGSDRIINAWDNNKKKKIYKSQHYPYAITSTSINSDGTMLAIASSEKYDDANFPDPDSPEDKHKIFIKLIDFI